MSLRMLLLLVVLGAGNLVHAQFAEGDPNPLAPAKFKVGEEVIVDKDGYIKIYDTGIVWKTDSNGNPVFDGDGNFVVERYTGTKGYRHPTLSEALAIQGGDCRARDSEGGNDDCLNLFTTSSREDIEAAIKNLQASPKDKNGKTKADYALAHNSRNYTMKIKFKPDVSAANKAKLLESVKKETAPYLRWSEQGATGNDNKNCSKRTCPVRQECAGKANNEQCKGMMKAFSAAQQCAEVMASGGRCKGLTPEGKSLVACFGGNLHSSEWTDKLKDPAVVELYRALAELVSNDTDCNISQMNVIQTGIARGIEVCPISMRTELGVGSVFKLEVSSDGKNYMTLPEESVLGTNLCMACADEYLKDDSYMLGGMKRKSIKQLLTENKFCGPDAFKNAPKANTGGGTDKAIKN